jgi:hypothetical protein
MQARPTTTTLTVDDFSKYIQNKRDLYEACERNGFYLPRLKTTMVTEEYMRQVIKGNSWCPMRSKIKMLGCPRPPNKSVLLEKFWNFVHFNRFDLECIDPEKHVPDKRWLLDVLATFTPEDEIFGKSYNPPERASKLSEIKTIEVPVDFMKDLPFSKRKTKRKGLRIQKEGLRVQKKMRFKIMQKKFADALLDEEVKDDEKETKKRSKTAKTATNEGTFKPPQMPSTPPRNTSGMTNNSSR